MTDRPLRILLAMPAYWPAHAFGGPVTAARELTRRLVERGHTVEVVTTTLTDVGRRAGRRTRVATVDGARVTYLATPLRYRWMGLPPSLPLWLRRAERPDVVHVAGYRDPVSTGVATWARRAGIPYVFEPLGMLRPRLRKVLLKRFVDASLARGVLERAALVLVVSEGEADDVAARGVPRERIVVRGLGFPDPASIPPPDGTLRASIGVGADEPLALSVGRIASGKGIEHLVAAARELPGLHVALVGPDDRHGAMTVLDDARRDPLLSGRIHALPPTDGPPLGLYGEADVFVLGSDGDSFGLVAAEAAAAGTPVVVTDRCGIATFFDEGEALVVPARRDAIVDAIRRVLGEASLARELAAGGLAAARRNTWERATDVQEEAYRTTASRTAATKLSLDGS